ncbi:MAG: SGNH/GDSL hydrolase family protein [Microcoleaceae cyanobacterium]
MKPLMKPDRICLDSRLRAASTVIGFVALGVVAALPTQAATFEFEQVYVFGDSISDPGNLFNLTGGAIPDNPLFFEGRFSNGLTWVEQLTPQLGLSPSPFVGVAPSPDGVNFAFGGATSGSLNIVNLLVPDFPAPLPGLQQQLEAFIQPLLATGTSANPDALYILWAGGNDYAIAGETDPSIPVDNLENAIQSLYDVGARKFLTVNLPDLGETPLGQFGNSEGLNTLAEFHNTGLEASIGNLNQSLSEIDIALVDVNTVFDAIIDNPANFNLTNVTDSWLDAVASCLSIGCAELPNPDEYLFFDLLHPTATGHIIIADVALTVVQAEFPRVPEPTATLALGFLGVGLVVSQFKSEKN